MSVYYYSLILIYNTYDQSVAYIAEYISFFDPFKKRIKNQTKLKQQ